MADVIQIQHTSSGVTLYALIRDADGAVWNGSSFVSYVTANLGTYDLPMTEQGTASRFYSVAVPALAAGLYQVQVFQQAGGSPAESDAVVGTGAAEWDGTRWTRLGAPAGASLAADLLAIDNLVDDLESRVGTPSNLGGGATLAANLADIEAQTDDIGSAGAGLTALATAAELAKVPKSDSNVTWNATAAAQLQSEAADALNAYDPPTKAELDSAVAPLALQTSVDDLESRLGTPSNLGSGATVAANLADIEAQTDDIGAAGAGLTAVPWNAAWDAEVQSEVQDALDATIADSVPSDGTRPSISQALYMLTQFMLERNVSGTTVTVRKPDGSTSLFTLTLNDASSPTSITRAS